MLGAASAVMIRSLDRVRVPVAAGLGAGTRMSRPKRRRGPSSRSARERPSLRAVSGNLPCAICGNSGRGPRTQRHLTHGVAVWLCDTHGSGAFMHRRAGREFTDRVAAVWTASGVLTVRRKQALEAHLRRVQMVGAERDRPGSYSWPALRREAERRFTAGEPPLEVIADLRGTYRDGPAMVLRAHQCGGGSRRRGGSNVNRPIVDSNLGPKRLRPS